MSREENLSAVGVRLVVMGVAGCGKSAVGQRIAQALGLPLIEGDEFHPRSQHRQDAPGRCRWTTPTAPAGWNGWARNWRAIRPARC